MTTHSGWRSWRTRPSGTSDSLRVCPLFIFPFFSVIAVVLSPATFAAAAEDTEFMPLINKSCTASERSCGVVVTWGTCLVGIGGFMVVGGRKKHLARHRRSYFTQCKFSKTKQKQEEQVGGVKPV